MRWPICLSAFAILALLTIPLAASQPIWPNSSPPYCRTGGTPSGFPLKLGCCEQHLPCAENAWDGYCEHKTKLQTHWYRFGTRAPAPPTAAPLVYPEAVCAPCCRVCCPEPE
jgi:hypothetical protein